MNIVGPERYVLAITQNVICRGVRARNVEVLRHRDVTEAESCTLLASTRSRSTFGLTKQPIRNRLRLGWNAKGETGYYGYAWPHHHENVFLGVWAHDDPPTENECLDIETVEAEVVFLIRSAGQWPKDQTEIHFHPSTDVTPRRCPLDHGAVWRFKPTHPPSVTVKRRTGPPVFLRARG